MSLPPPGSPVARRRRVTVRDDGAATPASPSTRSESSLLAGSMIRASTNARNTSSRRSPDRTRACRRPCTAHPTDAQPSSRRSPTARPRRSAQTEFEFCLTSSDPLRAPASTPPPRHRCGPSRGARSAARHDARTTRPAPPSPQRSSAHTPQRQATSSASAQIRARQTHTAQQTQAPAHPTKIEWPKSGLTRC